MTLPPEVALLIAEDSEDDRYLLAEAIRAAPIVNPVRFVPDGKQAVDYLSGTGAYADRRQNPLPGLVLLDLKMPLMNGFETLEWIRASGPKRLPVIILSASSLPGDIERAYDLSANSYLMKPSSLSALVNLMRAIRDYWLVFNEYSRLP